MSVQAWIISTLINIAILLTLWAASAHAGEIVYDCYINDQDIITHCDVVDIGWEV